MLTDAAGLSRNPIPRQNGCAFNRSPAGGYPGKPTHRSSDLASQRCWRRNSRDFSRSCVGSMGRSDWGVVRRSGDRAASTGPLHHITNPAARRCRIDSRRLTSNLAQTFCTCAEVRAVCSDTSTRRAAAASARPASTAASRLPPFLATCSWREALSANADRANHRSSRFARMTARTDPPTAEAPISARSRATRDCASRRMADAASADNTGPDDAETRMLRQPRPMPSACAVRPSRFPVPLNRRSTWNSKSARRVASSSVPLIGPR